MKNSTHTPHVSTVGDALGFQALVNDKPYLPTCLDGRRCLRSELEGRRNTRIWKVYADGKVAYRRTVFGLFIDQSLEPGIYDLVRDERVSAVYHRTPRQMAQLFHSQSFEYGSVTLLECDVQSGRLRGTFEFAIPAVNFSVREGAFDLLCGEDDLLASRR